MTKSWWGRFAVLAAVTTWAVIYVLPTVLKIDPKNSRMFFKQKMNMGLDLQGGIYIVLGVDFKKAFQDILLRQGEGIRQRSAEKNTAVQKAEWIPETQNTDDPTIRLTFADQTAGFKENLKSWIKKEYVALRLVHDSKPGELELGIAREYRQEFKDRTLTQSIEVIRNRIDEFGVAEPSIASQGTDRVVVELPGIKDVERAKELIGRTAKLEFRLVDDQTLNPSQLVAMIQTTEEEKKIKFSEGENTLSDYTLKINEALKSKIPADTEILFEKEGMLIPYLVSKKNDVTGEDLQDASVGVNPENQRPEVNLAFNPKGTIAFDQVTSANIGKRLAIVLDQVVHSAPQLKTRISNGRAVISLGQDTGEKLMQEAKDLSTVLRAGSLPARLDFLEQRVVGPSLGQDSIQKGVLAALIGSAAVLLFIIFYYRVSGVIAAFSLILNSLFVMACLVGLEATLTLPGIAGIALTIGIAVDSNVVIYERIREELRAGRNAWAAVDAGFGKAFRTILDANVTNAAAAAVLLTYGTGPIRGFAVTMLIGIGTTLFTAIFVCRILFDLYLKRLEKNRAASLSI